MVHVLLDHFIPAVLEVDAIIHVISYHFIYLNANFYQPIDIWFWRFVECWIIVEVLDVRFDIIGNYIQYYGGGLLIFLGVELVELFHILFFVALDHFVQALVGLLDNRLCRFDN